MPLDSIDRLNMADTMPYDSWVRVGKPYDTTAAFPCNLLSLWGQQNGPSNVITSFLLDS